MKKLIFLALFALSAARAQGLPPTNYNADVFMGHPSVYLSMDDAGPTFRDAVTGALFTSAGAGTTSFRQPGFNRLAKANYSALFVYNSKAVAPNNTLGDFEWSTPVSFSYHIRNTSISKVSSVRVEIASKGVMGSTLTSGDTTAKGWDLYINAPGKAVPCVALIGSGSKGGANIGFSVCANVSAGSDLFDSADHEVSVGSPGDAIPTNVKFMIDGQPVPTIVLSGGQQFGAVSIAITGGTGYANSTAFTSTGGGTFCVVSGTFASSGGVPTGAVTYTQNGGCTSTPTIVPTAPTGTGAALPATLVGASISNTSPLTIAGNVSDSIATQGANVHNAAGVQIDEFAMYPAAFTPSSPLPYQLFADSVPWQQFLAATSTPLLIIHSNDACADADNGWAIQAAIGLHQRGQIKMLHLNTTLALPLDTQMYRSMLDYGGLNHVPVSVSAAVSGVTAGVCNGIAVYSGSVAALASYPNSVAVDRKALATATTPVAYTIGGAWTSLDALLQSPADGISSLPGDQLALAHLSGVWVQSGFSGSTITGDTNIGEDVLAAQRVINKLNTLGIPLYLTSGGPTPGSGPTRYSLAPTSPFGIWLNQLFTATGGLTRSAWDTMAIFAPLMPSYFTNVQGTFALTGNQSTWSLSFTPGAGTGFWQVVKDQPSSNSMAAIINSLTGSNPVPKVLGQ